MKLPGMPPRHFDGVISLLDVMPTVLHGPGFSGWAPWRRARASAPPARREATAPLAPRDALTFQGVNERTRRFALTTHDRRILFELDDHDPLESRRLSVKDVTDLADASLVHGEARDGGAAYDRLVRDMPQIMVELPFLAP